MPSQVFWASRLEVPGYGSCGLSNQFEICFRRFARQSGSAISKAIKPHTVFPMPAGHCTVTAEVEAFPIPA